MHREHTSGTVQKVVIGTIAVLGAMAVSSPSAAQDVAVMEIPEGAGQSGKEEWKEGPIEEFTEAVLEWMMETQPGKGEPGECEILFWEAFEAMIAEAESEVAESEEPMPEEAAFEEAESEEEAAFEEAESEEETASEEAESEEETASEEAKPDE